MEWCCPSPGATWSFASLRSTNRAAPTPPCMHPGSAAATSGKTVLQLDAQDFYGGRWATLSIDDFLAALRPGQAAGATGLEVAGSTDPACIGESRAFLVDLAPRLVYGGGPMVDALLASGAHHYTEFKLLQGRWEGGCGTAIAGHLCSIRLDEALDIQLYLLA